MTRGRRIIVYIATSADGYIARPDGSVEWLNRPRTAGDYGMGEFQRSIDTILFGRRTYDEAVARYGGAVVSKRGPASYVFTHRPPASAPAGVTFVSEPVKTFAARLRAARGKDIWMMGGGGLIGSFLDDGEIDEFIIHVIPILIGEGIPLIQAKHRQVPLALQSARSFSDGVVRLHYTVERP